MASHEDIAIRLREAYADGAAPPRRDAFEPTYVDGAYAVQPINTRFWESQGRRRSVASSFTYGPAHAG